MALQRPRTWIVGIPLAVVILGVGWTFAQQAVDPPAPETLLPAKSLVYFGAGGALLHAEAWEQTAAYEALEASGLMPTLRDTIEHAFEIAVEMGAPEDIGLILGAIQHLQDHGLSFAATVAPPQGGPPSGYAILVLHRAAEFEEALSAVIQQATERQLNFETADRQGRSVTSAVIPGSPGVELGWWNERGHLVIVAGIGGIDSTLAIAGGTAPNLTQHPLWQKYIAAQEDFAVTTNGWIDVAGIRNLVAGIPLPIEQSDPAAPPVTVGHVLNLVGLGGINAIFTQGGYKEAALWNETWIESPAPRQGLLAVSDVEPLTLDDLPPLPQAMTSFLATRVDLTRLYDELLSTVRAIVALIPEEDAAEQLEAGLAMVEAKLGLDLKADLFAHLGPTIVAYDDPRQGILGIGRATLIELQNPDAFAASIDAILEVVDEVTEGQVIVRRAERNGREVVIVEAPQSAMGVSWCIADEWLVLGQPQSIEAYLLRVDGVLPRWEPSEEHQEALAAMPQSFTSLTVSDPRGAVNLVLGLAPTLLSVVKTFLRSSPDFEGLDLPLEVEDLPPAELVSQPLFPNVMIAEVTEEGFHYQSRSSLPGIPLIGSGDAATTTAVVAVGVALLLPAVQQVRAAARRSQSQNNLRQLALGMHNYEATHRRLPPGTILNAQLEPEQRLSWIVEILPYIEEAAVFQGIDRSQGWEAPQNRTALESLITVLLNPGVADDPSLTLPDGTEAGATHYIGIAGLGEEGPTRPVNDPKAGMFGYNRATRIADVTDGLSNTVMISEASGDFGPWGAGGRSSIRAFTREPYINGPDRIGGPYGGANMALGDGSVRFINPNIDPRVMEALSTIRGGEVIPEF